MLVITTYWFIVPPTLLDVIFIKIYNYNFSYSNVEMLPYQMVPQKSFLVQNSKIVLYHPHHIL